MGAAATQALPAIAALPGAFLALAQGGLVAKIALGGIGEALGGNQEALKKFGPQGRAFIKTLKGFSDEWTEFRRAVGEPIFKPLTQAVGVLIPKLPVLGKILGRTAEQVGVIADTFAVALTRGKNFARLKDFMRGNTQFLKIFTTSMNRLGGATNDTLTPIDHLVSLATKFAVAIQPITMRFGRWIAQLIAAKDAATQVGTSTTGLMGTLNNAANVASQLGDIFDNIWKAFGNLSDASSEAGRGLLDSFEAATAKFREFTGAAENQDKFQEYFAKTADNLRAVGELLNSLGRVFAKLGDNPGVKNLSESIVKAEKPLQSILDKLTGDLTSNAFGNLIESVIRLTDTLTQAGQIKAFFDTLSVGVKIITRIVKNIEDFGKVTEELTGINLVGVGLGLIAIYRAAKLLIVNILGLAGSFNKATASMSLFFRQVFLTRGGIVALGNSTALLSARLLFMRGGLRLLGQQAAVSLRTMSTGTKVLLGSAGFMGLTESVNSSNKAVNVLGSALSGAALGAMTGNPWGIAAGAIGGLGVGIWKAARGADDATESLDKTKQATEAAKNAAEEYKNTLNQVTGEVTKLTREQALNRLDKTGVLPALNRLNIPTRVAVDAALGDPAAIERVKKATEDLLSVTQKLSEEKLELRDRLGFGVVMDIPQEEVDRFNEVTGLIESNKRLLDDLNKAEVPGLPSIFTDLNKLNLEGKIEVLRRNLSLTTANEEIKKFATELLTIPNQKQFVIDTIGVGRLKQAGVDLEKYGIKANNAETDTRRLNQELSKGGSGRPAPGWETAANQASKINTQARGAAKEAGTLNSVLSNVRPPKLPQGGNTFKNLFGGSKGEKPKAPEVDAKPLTRSITSIASKARGLARGVTAQVRAGFLAMAPFAPQLGSFMARQINQAINAARGPKGADEGSPSKKTRKIGKNIGLGFLVGLHKTRKELREEMINLMKDLTKHGQIGAKNLLENLWKNTLSRVSAQFENVSKSIEKTTEKLKKQKEELRNYAKEVKDAVLATGDISKFADQTAMVDFLTNSVEKAREFAASLKQLKSLGLSRPLFKQIASAGPEALSAAQALIESGAGGVKQVNRLYSQLNQTAVASGKTASEYMYRAGIKASQGLLAGLKARRAQIGAQLTRIGLNLVAQLQSAFGVVLNKGSWNPPKFASGGVAPGGWAIVGERGRELVNLNKGARVYSNSDTEKMLGRASHSTVVINQNYYGPTTSGGRRNEMVWAARYATRARPQRVEAFVE